MLLVFALILFAVWLAIRRSGSVTGGKGWRWFAAWSVAGALVTFTVLTGLSIGLFVLPAAAAALLWVAARAPHLPEAIGFVEGMGAVLLLVAYLGEPMPWLLAGSIATVCPLAAYAVIEHASCSS